MSKRHPDDEMFIPKASSSQESIANFCNLVAGLQRLGLSDLFEHLPPAGSQDIFTDPGPQLHRVFGGALFCNPQYFRAIKACQPGNKGQFLPRQDGITESRYTAAAF